MNTINRDVMSDIIVSPSRLEILNKLFDSPDGLTFDELAKQMSEKAGLQRHLDVLLKGSVIEDKGGVYSLSKNGLDVYYVLGDAAIKLREDGLLSHNQKE